MVCAVTFIKFCIGSNKHKNREELTFLIRRENILSVVSLGRTGILESQV